MNCASFRIAPVRSRRRTAPNLWKLVAGELEKYRELGPGLVSRVSRELQRQHFNPPSFRGDGFAKYGR
jgi:hypothetical protein